MIILLIVVIILIIIIVLQYLHIRKSMIVIIYICIICFVSENKESTGEKEVTALGNISSISNEAYAAIDNDYVQENVSYSLPQRHTITAASPPTGSSTAPAAE